MNNSNRTVKVDWEKVELLEKLKNWNDSDLAKALGYSPAYISKIKSEESPASLKFIERLGSLLDLPIENICYFIDKDGDRIDKMGVNK
jgi:transcriptional regulator with XRE-family HTH domain